MSETVQKLFTDISPTYDRLNHFLSFNIDKSWRKKTISKIQKTPDENFIALDLCAGTHDLGLECLRQFPKAEIIALDFSYGMLQAGQNKISKEFKAGQITPVCGDALNMPFADNTFDVIFCAYGVRNFDCTEKGLNEIRRVLKPDGQILVLEFFKPTSAVNRLFNNTYGEYILPLVGQWISGHKSAYAYLRDSIRGFLNVSEFEKLLEKTGYKEIKNKNFFMSISTCVSAQKAQP